MIRLSSAVLLLFALYSAYGQKYTYNSLGYFKSDSPGFLNLGYFSPENYENSSPALSITSFSGAPLVKGSVHIVPNIGEYLDDVSQIKPTLVTKSLVWPNEATAVPYNIFKESVLGLGNGFLVPGKSTGAVSITPANTSKPHIISTTKKDWFYHVAEWWDMDGDGLMDCVSARATDPDDPADGPARGELVWFKNPGANAFSQTWEETVVTPGPDIIIHLVHLQGYPSNQPQIIATEFFSNRLSIYWTENNSTWSNVNTVQSLVIDDTLGSPFDVQYFDLNNDGRKDLLVTNHEPNANQSAVFAYIVPENWKSDPWKRYVLATNIPTLKRGIGQASPGRAKAFYPNLMDTGMKPYIVVGGDGAEIAFMLYPNSEDPNDWSYTREDIINVGCTVGQVEVGDVNGDNFSEIFVPAFEHKKVFVYSYGNSK